MHEARKRLPVAVRASGTTLTGIFGVGPLWPGLLPGLAGLCSDYFKVSGIGAPRRSKACRWVLVGSVSIGTVARVPAKRTWLRVRVARWSSRARKLR
jgi:hypothetical protein